MRSGAAQILVCDTTEPLAPRRDEPTKDMPCRRTGRLGALVLRPPSRVCSGEAAARIAVNSRAGVRGRRMLRPDVAEISRPRLAE